MPFANLNVRLKFNTLTGMYSFDVPSKQYHRQSKFIDPYSQTWHTYDRSLRAVFGQLMTANTTQEYNRQTTIFEEVHDAVYYQKGSYNWTEADMVYMKPRTLAVRLDYRFHEPKDLFSRDPFLGKFYFDINIESYNLWYNNPAYLETYTKNTWKVK